MADRWTRPAGCACPLTSPRRERCDERWMRCNERIRFEKQKTMAAIAASLAPRDAAKGGE